MSLANYTPRQQSVSEQLVTGGGWTQYEVLTNERCSLLRESIVVMRTPHEAPFLDLSIEEFVGTTRRSKFSSVRLEREAALTLYNMLAKHFAPGADHA